MQGLDCVLTEALHTSRLEGVRFRDEGLHLAQQFYADNTTVILKGTRLNIEYCRELFGVFGTTWGFWYHVGSVVQLGKD